MTPKQFIETHKDTDKIVSMHYESGVFDHVLTAYPKGITNPHVVEFKASSTTNWKRMMRMLDSAISD